MKHFLIGTVIWNLGVLGRFNDPVSVNDEILRRLDNYDKACFQ